MAILNDVTNDLLVKVVYVGCRHCGKTTNLQSIYKQTSKDVTSRFFDLHAVTTKLPYFDFLPLSLGENRSQTIKLHLYTLPAVKNWKTLQRQLLRGVDGIVWVVDSRSERLEENEIFLRSLEAILAEVQLSFEEIPLVIQFNHRDSKNSISVQALKSVFARKNSYQIEAVAVQDIGVLETVEAMTDLLIQTMENLPKESLTPSGHFDATSRQEGIRS